MFDARATEREDRLVLLCALSRLGVCTQEQLMRFLVEAGLQGQFQFLLALSELREGGFVREVVRPEGRLLVLTQEGRQSVELFGAEIRASLQERLNAQAGPWRERIREELQMPADWEETGEGFLVTLRALEAGQEIFLMKLTAATRQQARRFCERWPKCAPRLYQTVVNALGEDEKPAAEEGAPKRERDEET